MSDSLEVLRSSYSECRRIACKAGSNFTPCFYLLSRKQRRGMETLYAFMRHTDDLVDGETASEDVAQGLVRWRDETAGALTGARSEFEGPAWILPALADTMGRFEIPHEHLFAAIDGAEMDLAKDRYETFDELAEYCYRVATVVGLACLRIWGYRGGDPAKAAHACGMAFQLTNILRDLCEDRERGRVYLPQEDLRRFGYSEDDLAAATANGQFLDLMRFQIERAERFYREATELAEGLEGGGRRIFVMMIRVYYQLLQEIQSAPARVLSERVRLRRWQPLGIMARTLLRPSAKAVLP